MELLNRIQRELKVPKAQYNSFSKYHYRNAEDILEAVKPLLGDKATLTLSDEIVMCGVIIREKIVVDGKEKLTETGARFYVKATATLNDGKESVTATAYAREAHDKKGMDEAQITGAASSYARKYALCGLFCIDDGKDADSDDNTGPNRHDKQNVPFGSAAKPTPPKKVADQREAQKKRIKELVDGIALVDMTTAEEYKTYVKGNTGYELVEENYSSIIDALEAQQN